MKKYRTYIYDSIFGCRYDNKTFPNYEENRKRLNTYLNSKWSISWDRNVADLLNITPTQMSRIINCYSKLSLETVIKLAWLCNTTVDHILQLEDQIDMLDPTLKKYIKS